MSTKNTETTDTENTTHENGAPTVVDFAEYRAQRLEEKRRKNERVLINHFLGVYAVSNFDSLYQVELIDLSDGGCSFQVPIDAQKPWPADKKDFNIRLYFSQETFLSVPVDRSTPKDGDDQPSDLHPLRLPRGRDGFDLRRLHGLRAISEDLRGRFGKRLR